MKTQSLSSSLDEQNVGVGIFVFDKTGKKVLLGKRKNSFRAGTWGIPGGRATMTESIEDAMKRELWEETGIKPIKFEYLGVVREYQKELSGSFIHFIFKCTKYSGEIKNVEPSKCERWVWHDLKKLPKNILKGHKLALDLLTNKSHLVDYVG